MEFLKRDLAPITDKAWNEIHERAKHVLQNSLTGRRVVKVTGPKGRDLEGISTGRMKLKKTEDMVYGVYEIQPLVETRINFTLNRWELDNIERGAKNANLEALDEAATRAAKFEDAAIFYGLEEACIEGLKSSSHPVQKLGTTDKEIMKSLINGVNLLLDAQGDRPFALVVNRANWIFLNTVSEDPEFMEKVEKILGMPIFVSDNVKESFLIPYDDDNLELSIGMDYSIGYQDNSDQTVKLFITSSFAFTVHDKTQIVVFE